MLWRATWRPFAALLLLFGLAACGKAASDRPTGAATVRAVLAQDPLSEPQATSLLGEPLFAQPDTSGAVARADSALSGAPDDVELLIAAGRERRNVWQYRQAMALYTRAMELAPQDWRAPRFRGHRHLSVREFDRGIADLARARELAPYNWDVAYHLGLAHFLAGHFDEAADAYLRCLGLAEDDGARAAQSESFRSCSQNDADLESRVAMTEWAVRALLRAGRDQEAGMLVANVDSGWPVEENIAYYHDLLWRKGLKTEAELLEGVESGLYRLETVGFAVANQRLAQGDTAGARGILEELAADPWWPGFGRIAAEAELVRMGEVR
ncbi:MAG: hypothetical protein R3E10_07030 [Gemmatimonadota bacterium]